MPVPQWFCPSVPPWALPILRPSQPSSEADMVVLSSSRRWSRQPGWKQVGPWLSDHDPHCWQADGWLRPQNLRPQQDSARSRNLNNRERQYLCGAGGAGRRAWRAWENFVSAREEKPGQGLHPAPVGFAPEVPKCYPHLEGMSLAAPAETPPLDDPHLDQPRSRQPSLEHPDLENKPRGLRPESSFNPMRLDLFWDFTPYGLREKSSSRFLHRNSVTSVPSFRFRSGSDYRRPGIQSTSQPMESGSGMLCPRLLRIQIPQTRDASPGSGKFAPVQCRCRPSW